MTDQACRRTGSADRGVPVDRLMANRLLLPAEDANRVRALEERRRRTRSRQFKADDRALIATLFLKYHLDEGLEAVVDG